MRTTSTSTRTPTRESCTCEHALRARSLRCTPLDVCVTRTSWLKVFLSLTSSHLHTCAFLSDLTFLPFYFDLTFTVLFHFSFLMHPEQHTELDNLNTMQHNLRTSAKGSNDAYDVSVSLTAQKSRRVPNTSFFNETTSDEWTWAKENKTTPADDNQRLQVRKIEKKIPSNGAESTKINTYPHKIWKKNEKSTKVEIPIDTKYKKNTN